MVADYINRTAKKLFEIRTKADKFEKTRRHIDTNIKVAAFFLLIAGYRTKDAQCRNSVASTDLISMGKNNVYVFLRCLYIFTFMWRYFAILRRKVTTFL